jgi:hypothetical protein
MALFTFNQPFVLRFGVFFGFEDSSGCGGKGEWEMEGRRTSWRGFILLGAVLSRGADGLGIRDVILVVGGAYLVDVVRRVAFVARRVWACNCVRGLRKMLGLEGERLLDGIGAVGIGSCACEMLGVERGRARKTRG